MSETKFLPLMAEPENRDTTTSRDARLINGYTERKGKTLHVFKRPCLLANVTVEASAVGRGVYNWQGNIYSIFGSTLYKDGVSHGTSLDTTNGVYTFSQCLGGTPQLFMHNGVAAYVTDGTTFATVTDADFPAASVKGSAYLDGTTYVMTALAAIQGSDINDPTAWDALNTLIAQIEPDGGVFLAKQLVYVVAFKEWSVEAFYDKANASGSPLGTVQGVKISYGCRTAGSVQEIDGSLYWVSQTREGAVGVMELRGMRAESIATPAIERLLQSLTFTTTHSWGFHLNGHKFYGITVPADNLTLVYDIGQKEWSQWTDTSDDYWPIVDATYDTSQRVVVQHETNGKLYFVDAATHQDDSALISWELYTPPWTGEKDQVKCVSRTAIVGDVVASSTLDVRVSDDDYATWSEARTFDLSQAQPFLPNWGSFYRRAHHLKHRANTALRLEALALTIALGS